MESGNVGTDVTLRLERRIGAPREKVFEAWTHAEAMSRWFAPAADFTVRVHALEPRPGGRYRIEMRDPKGDAHIVVGAFREVRAPEQLAFTWTWEGKEADGETLVTVTLHPDGGGTRLVLIHERFTSAELRDKHLHGWTGCLDRLAITVAS